MPSAKHYPVYDITNERGIPMRVRIVQEGQRYGLNDALVYSADDKHEPYNGDVLVEFFDRRYDHTPNGQFISRYYANTLLAIKGGLNLCGGVSDWRLSMTHMWVVQAFIHGVKEALK